MDDDPEGQLGPFDEGTEFALAEPEVAPSPNLSRSRRRSRHRAALIGALHCNAGLMRCLMSSNLGIVSRTEGAGAETEVRMRFSFPAATPSGTRNARVGRGAQLRVADVFTVPGPVSGFSRTRAVVPRSWKASAAAGPACRTRVAAKKPAEKKLRMRGCSGRHGM
eukprot:364836-Chlamydomonas_euryale.AAC.5